MSRVGHWERHSFPSPKPNQNLQSTVEAKSPQSTEMRSSFCFLFLALIAVALLLQKVDAAKRKKSPSTHKPNHEQQVQMDETEVNKQIFEHFEATLEKMKKDILKFSNFEDEFANRLGKDIHRSPTEAKPKPKRIRNLVAKNQEQHTKLAEFFIMHSASSKKLLNSWIEAEKRKHEEKRKEHNDETIVTKVLKSRFHEMNAPKFKGIQAHEFKHIIGKLYHEQHKKDLTKPKQPGSPTASGKGQNDKGHDHGGLSSDHQRHLASGNVPPPASGLNPAADHHPHKPANPTTSIAASHKSDNVENPNLVDEPHGFLDGVIGGTEGENILEAEGGETVKHPEQEKKEEADEPLYSKPIIRGARSKHHVSSDENDGIGDDAEQKVADNDMDEANGTVVADSSGDGKLEENSESMPREKSPDAAASMMEDDVDIKNMAKHDGPKDAVQEKLMQ